MLSLLTRTIWMFTMIPILGIMLLRVLNYIWPIRVTRGPPRLIQLILSETWIYETKFTANHPKCVNEFQSNHLTSLWHEVQSPERKLHPLETMIVSTKCHGNPLSSWHVFIGIKAMYLNRLIPADIPLTWLKTNLLFIGQWCDENNGCDLNWF